MHNFRPEVIELFERAIWNELCTHSSVALSTSPKDRYPPRKAGALGIFSLGVSIHKTTVHTCLRHINSEGQPRTDQIIKERLYSPHPNLILKAFVDAAQALDIHTHGWGHSNPCLTHQLRGGEQLLVRSNDNAYHRGLVGQTGKHPVVDFDNLPFKISNTSDFSF